MPLRKEMCTIVDDRCSRNACRRRKPTSRNVKALFCLFIVSCLISSEITLPCHYGRKYFIENISINSYIKKACFKECECRICTTLWCMNLQDKLRKYLMKE